MLHRPRLFALLDEGLSRPLTLVSAPAGFGKSTLVSTWVQSKLTSNTLAAWISLDEGDNDPRRFWSYVIAALERCQPGVYQPFLTVLQERQISLQYLLTALLNTLQEQRAPLFIIFDDYHVITEQAIHTSLTSFIERLPPHTHLVLVTHPFVM